MASYKTCFYCKQQILASDFKKHLKLCPARGKPKKPPQFGSQQPQQHGGGAGGGMMASHNNNNNDNGWNCPMCSFHNKANDMTCNMCRQGKRPNNLNGGGAAAGPGPGPAPPSGPQGGTWQCPSCTFYNSDVAVSCKICQNPKPKKVAQQQPPPQQQQQQQQPPQPPPPRQQQQQPQPPNNNPYFGGPGGPGPGPDPFAELDPNNQFMQNLQNPVQRQQFNDMGGEGGGGGPPPGPNSVRAKAAMFQNMNNNGPPNYAQMRGPPPPGPGPMGGGGQPPQRPPPPGPMGGYMGNQPQGNIGMGGGPQQPPPQHQQQGNIGMGGGGPLPPDPAPVGGGGGGADDYSQYTGFDDMDLGSMDPDTRSMIIQMLGCSKCQKAKADLELNCGHKLCQKCAKSYLFDGYVKKKWERESITCPMAGCEQQLPDVALRNCGISENMIKEIETQQRKFLVSSDDNMTQCPKCQNYFMTEVGDVNAFNPKEKGPDGKQLSYAHQKHKAQWRFRCSQCSTIFCGSCKTVPYHLGYTCQEWQNYQEAKKCRFCEKKLEPGVNEAPKEYGVGPGLSNVCNDGECLKKRSWSCDRILQCGHNCIGMRGERNCMECLHPDCAKNRNSDLNHDEFCNICWVDPLFAAPTIKLECGHYFHFMCVWNKIDRKWPAARITFGFLNCPLCKQEMKHEAITEMAKKYYLLKEQIKKDAVERLKIEGLENDKRLTDPNSPYHNNLEQFALDRLAFYPCSKCKKPYFGGMKACEEAGMQQEEKYDQNHLVCGSCASGPNAKSCALHGKKYITYKCKFCCSMATWFCWGNTHFCDKCHKKQEKGIYLNRKPISELPKCPGPELCPLRVDHPPNGVAEYSLGCVVCMRK